MYEKLPLLVLSVLAFVLVVVIITPFGAPLFMGAVLAASLYPLQRMWCGRLKWKPELVAGLITLGTFILLILPLAFVAVVVANEFMHSIEYGRALLKQVNEGGLQSLVDKMPSFAQRYLRHRAPWMQEAQRELVKFSAAQGGAAALAVGKALAAGAKLIVDTIFMLIAFFFLLIDGKKLVQWVTLISPLPIAQTEELISEFQKTSKAALVSTVLTAGVQSIVALAGYLIVSVPQAAFLTVLTFLVALVPAVGAASVVVLVAVFQFATGHPVAATFLAIWGLVPVALVDNLVKPLLIRNEVQVHGAIVFFSLLGGLAVFGPVGLIAGPLIVSFFQTTMRFLHPDLSAGRSAGAEVHSEP